MWDEGDAGLKTAERPMVAIRKLGDEVKVRFIHFWCFFLEMKLMIAWVL
jgi:hypothetical protein